MDKPNVILLVTHDTGRHVSPYGARSVRTPQCERLARESILFENSFCTAPQCSPSRASLVTGRYPHATGTLGLTHADFGWSLHASERPVATIVGEAGYETWLLGLQHETGDPASLGFSTVDLGFSLLDLPDHLAPLLAARDDSRPFFCQIGCFETHRPFTKFDTPPDNTLGVDIPPYLVAGPETRREIAEMQGMIARFDDGLGLLLNLLERENLVENTVLIVTTDHGVALPRAKGTLFDAGIETMLFVRYPRRWTGGTRCSELISNIDILPSILELTGVPVPADVHGRSFVQLLDARRPTSGPAARGAAAEDESPQKESGGRDEVFAEKTFHGCYDPMRCVRTRTHKYIRYFEKSTVHRVPGDILGGGAMQELGPLSREGHEALYDVTEDPLETRNLADDPGHRALRDNLRFKLYTWMKETEDPLLKGPVASPFYRRGMEELESAAGLAAPRTERERGEP